MCCRFDIPDCHLHAVCQMKKAIAVTELVIIILAIGAGIGLLTFTRESAVKIGCQRDVDLCRSSFAFYKRLKGVVGVAGIPPRIDCVAVSPPNCGETVLKTEDKKETMHVIAENLRWCWHKTLGKDNTIGEDFAEVAILPRGGPIIGKEDDVDFCLVCSEFTPKIDITAAEWDGYLGTRKIPKSDVTYEEFLDPSGPEIWGKKYRDTSFAKGRTYYVVSVSAEETKGDGQVFIYIDPEINCGTEDPQVHYQLQ